MSGRLIQRRRGVVVAGLMTTLVTAVTTTAALAQQREPTRAPAVKEVEDVAYDRLIEVYRGGAIDRAIDDLRQLLTREEWQRQGDPQRRLDTWILKAQRLNRQADLEALFLLCTEAIFKAWPERSPYRLELMPYWAPLERLEGIAAAHEPEVVRSSEPGTYCGSPSVSCTSTIDGRAGPSISMRPWPPSQATRRSCSRPARDKSSNGGCRSRTRSAI